MWLQAWTLVCLCVASLCLLCFNLSRVLQYAMWTCCVDVSQAGLKHMLAASMQTDASDEHFGTLQCVICHNPCSSAWCISNYVVTQLQSNYDACLAWLWAGCHTQKFWWQVAATRSACWLWETWVLIAIWSGMLRNVYVCTDLVCVSVNCVLCYFCQ